MGFILAAGLLDPNFGLAIWISLVFLILLFLLWKFAWGPITHALAQREETIDASIKRAETALAEAKAIQAENERARREADQEAQRILREAREAADRLRAEEVERTKAQIQHLQEQARAEIEREKQSALDQLRTEVADLAILGAQKILQENLDDARQRRLVDRFIDELPARKS